MVYTLRITSVVALLLTLGLAGIYMVSGIGHPGNSEILCLLASPSAIEIFEKNHADVEGEARSGTSSLVEAAIAFTKEDETVIIVDNDHDGPKPPPPSEPSPPPSAKFDLVAVCHFPSDPNLSCASIRMKHRKQYRLLNIGDIIGHQVLKDIQDGQLILQQTNGRGLQTLSMPQVACHTLIAQRSSP